MPEKAAVEEEDWGGLPVVSASTLRLGQGRESQREKPTNSQIDVHESHENLPSLREMLSTLDALDSQHSAIPDSTVAGDPVVDNGDANSAAGRPTSPEKQLDTRLAEAAQLNPDAPTWSFVKAQITGTRQRETSRIKAFEDLFEEVENSALRAPAKQPQPKRAIDRPQPEPQTIRMMMDQNSQGWDISWEGTGDGSWEQWQQQEPTGSPLTGPRLMASQLGVGKNRSKGRGKGKSHEGDMRGTAPHRGQQHFQWDEHLPWEEPLPWESGPSRLQTVREQLLPQPRPGQDQAEWSSWQLPAPSSRSSQGGSAKGPSATETLPGTRGLRKPGAPPPVRRGAGGMDRRVPSVSGSPLEYAPLKCGHCFERTYCLVECSRQDCWQTF